MMKPRILCLDDQPETLRVRALFLEQFGCEVFTVSSGQECLRRVTEEPYDLLLLDYHLAENQTGEDVARDVRMCCPSVPLILLTGDSKIPATAMESVDAVLFKGSSNPAELLATIQEFLPHCALRRPRGSLIAGLQA